MSESRELKNLRRDRDAARCSIRFYGRPHPGDCNFPTLRYYRRQAGLLKHRAELMQREAMELAK